MKISGKFEVTLKPLDTYAESTEALQLARMSIDKTFFGELSATSKGEMLSARTQVEGSAGYVAIELVTGELDGKQGSFVLQHFGTMGQGQHHLTLEVVPDSGTDDLQGLSGTMDIQIDNGQHFYTFDYQLGE